MDFLLILGIAGLVLALLFGFVVLFGAPYLPTLGPTRKDTFDLLDLKPGETFVDLGCGDGTMLIEAAKRDLNAIGYELNPLLVIISWLRTLPYKGRVKVRLGSFWKADLSNADGVFVFLITHHMERLDRFLSVQSSSKTLKVASNAFKIPGKKPIDKRGAVLLYLYGKLAR